MNIVSSEQIIVCDVDETLVHNMKPDEQSENVLTIHAQNTDTRVTPIQEHIDLVKQQKHRGFFVVVWSKRGYEWANAVVNALGMEHSVDMIMTKPTCYIDDVDCTKWMGERIYLLPQK